MRLKVVLGSVAGYVGPTCTYDILVGVSVLETLVSVAYCCPVKII